MASTHPDELMRTDHRRPKVMRTDQRNPLADTQQSEGAVADTHQSERRLRTVLRVNAAFSAVSGAVLALGGGAIDEVLETGQVGIIRLVGLGLVLFAVDLLLTTRLSGRRLRNAGLLFAVADDAWVIGSIATVAFGWYSGAGNALVLAAAAVVGGFAVAEVVTARRIAGDER